MDGVWVAVGGFFGATLGSLVTGYLVELYRQKNRLQLAAVEKRLQAHQEGYKWALDVGVCILTLQGIEKEMSDNTEAIQTAQADLYETRNKAGEWWSKNCLYLDKEVSNLLGLALMRGGLDENNAASKALEQAVGLPRLTDDQRPFRLSVSIDK